MGVVEKVRNITKLWPLGDFLLSPLHDDNDRYLGHCLFPANTYGHNTACWLIALRYCLIGGGVRCGPIYWSPSRNTYFCMVSA